MSDELTQAPDEIQETPAEGAPDAGTRTEEESINWEKRFKDLQPELTKAQQEAARLRAIDEGLRNPERAAEVLSEYGYSFGEDDPAQGDDTELDPVSTLEQRLTAQEERERQRVEQEGLARFNADLDQLVSDKDMTLSKRERSAVYFETLQNGGSPEALQKVVEDLVEDRKAYDKAVVDRYIKSKKDAPFVSPGGTGANEVTDPLDGKARRERLAARLDANGY